jgi:hypothetical protein
MNFVPETAMRGFRVFLYPDETRKEKELKK